MTIVDGRRERGARSRRDIMNRAVQVASVGGLDGLTIGRLAAETSVSKSGVVALFGTKEQLQLATIAAAREVFLEHVIQPALAAPSGVRRLRAVIEAWIDYSGNRVFAGGCFFASAQAEFGARPGVVRDAIAREMADWHEFLRRAAARAVEFGELSADTDPDQLAFELVAVLEWANSVSVLTESQEPYRRVRAAAVRLLGE